MSYEGNDWRTRIAEPRQTTKAEDLAKQPNVDRIYAPAWLVASTTQVKYFTPSRPVVLLCLGPDDESGGFVIESDELGGSGFATVAPNAPWFGRLTRPFRLRPVFRDNTGITETCVLDGLAFYELPPVVPVRAALKIEGTLDSTGGVTQVNCNVLGRRRVRVFTGVPAGGANANVKIWGYAIAPTTIVGSIFAGDNAVTTEMWYEWDPTRAVPSSAFNQGGISVPDRVAILLGTVGRTVDYSIVAWDY
jgi:hypothetical protein